MVVVDEADVVSVITDVLHVSAMTRYGEHLSTEVLDSVCVHECTTVLAMLCKRKQLNRDIIFEKTQIPQLENSTHSLSREFPVYQEIRFNLVSFIFLALKKENNTEKKDVMYVVQVLSRDVVKWRHDNILV